MDQWPFCLVFRVALKVHQKFPPRLALVHGWLFSAGPFSRGVWVRDAEMTIKLIFERSSQKGGRQRVRKEGQQGTHIEILLSA